MCTIQILDYFEQKKRNLRFRRDLIRGCFWNGVSWLIQTLPYSVGEHKAWLAVITYGQERKPMCPSYTNTCLTRLDWTVQIQKMHLRMKDAVNEVETLQTLSNKLATHKCAKLRNCAQSDLKCIYLGTDDTVTLKMRASLLVWNSTVLSILIVL